MLLALVSTTPMMSDSFMMRRSWPSMLTSVPDHLPNSTRSPAFTSRDELAALVAGARPDGDDLALLRLLLGGVRDDDAALRLLVGLDAADHDAVVQRTECHGDPPCLNGGHTSAGRRPQRGRR